MLYRDEATDEVTTPNWRDLKDKQKYKEWRPKKRLTRSEMEHLKHLHSVLPDENSISQLASKFNISAHSVTRILSSKFEPSPAIRERQDKRALEQKEQRKLKWEQKNQRYKWTDLE